MKPSENIQDPGDRTSRVRRRFRSVGRPYLDEREKQLKKAFGDISRFLMPVLFAGFAMWLGFHHTVDIGASLVHSFTSSVELRVCDNFDVIKHLQSEQLRKARMEIFGRYSKENFYK